MIRSQTAGEFEIAITLAERNWAGVRISDKPAGIPQRGPRVAPALILQRVVGETPRLDDYWPPHPRGIGEFWPPESRVNREYGAGRFPTAAMWTGLFHDFSWNWHIDKKTHEVSAAEALGAAAASLANRYRVRSCILAVPNWLGQQEQQTIIDSARRNGITLRLVWQPVAAALAFLEDHGHAVKSGTDFLHVQCGWDTVTVTQLHIREVKRDGTYWKVPARRRPSRSVDTIPGCGWSLAEGYLQDFGKDAWSKAFASRDFSNEVRFEESQHGQFETRTSSWNLLDSQGWQVKQSGPQAIRQWLQDHLQANRNVCGVVADGDLARFLIDDEAFSMTSCAPERRIILSPTDSSAYIAKGAGLFGHRLNHSQPTYLDTLPQLEMMVESKGMHEWINLLGEDEQFVDGGRAWQRPEPIRGLSVRRGAESLHLAVNHEEYTTVRELDVRFPYPAPESLPAELHVSAVPAAGHAKLELRFQEPVFPEHDSIVADWRRMVITEFDREQYLDKQPRSFPDLMPRKASPNRWAVSRDFIQETLEKLRVGKLPRKYDLDRVKSILQQKDQTMYPDDATVVDSDGLPSSKSLIPKQLGDAIWSRYKSSRGPELGKSVRCLGYISYDDANFEKWLINNLNSLGQDAAAVRHTCGHCLRSPDLIAKFVSWVLKRCPEPTTTGVTDNLKALSQILRYRPDATASLHDQAEAIMSFCLQVFHYTMESGGGSYAFRWSALVIVFLLRRRMYDTGFFDPESTEAQHAKDLFRDAIKRHAAGSLRPIGGSVDVPAALQQMIDYIDRRGTGFIQFAAGD